MDVTDAVFELLGDYNHNGTVDAADYTVWRDNLGTMNLQADGDDNGVIDQADYTVQQSHFGNTLALLGVTVT